MDWDNDVKPLLTSFVRHGLTTAAGALGAAGALNSDQQVQFISVGSALVLYALSQGWALWQKRKQAAALAAAKEQAPK